mmetsp:Transcript_31767/g.92810  ORF Transcript_31767/g.92810 Transcript_31767/m.92810 type:complete len:212 (+) Transcript_31767:446-1081(+)
MRGRQPFHGGQGVRGRQPRLRVLGQHALEELPDVLMDLLPTKIPVDVEGGLYEVAEQPAPMHGLIPHEQADIDIDGRQLDRVVAEDHLREDHAGGPHMVRRAAGHSIHGLWWLEEGRGVETVGAGRFIAQGPATGCPSAPFRLTHRKQAAQHRALFPRRRVLNEEHIRRVDSGVDQASFLDALETTEHVDQNRHGALECHGCADGVVGLLL